MDIRAALAKEHSKKQSQLIAHYIGGDQERFDELMDLFLHDEEWRITQRAAWVLSHCADCLLYTSPSPRDLSTSRMPSSA